VDADEPKLYALAVTPRRVRPGETARLLFRTANLSGAAHEARVRFVLDAGLEPLGPTEVALTPVAPGDAYAAQLDVRAVAASASELAASAVFALGERCFPTNDCTLRVCGRAVLDGAASGVRVEWLDAHTVRVEAVLTNEGDADAHDLELIVPAPRGTRACSSPAATRIAVLAPGASARTAFEASLVAPVPLVRCEDAYVVAGDGTRYALPARAHVRTQAALAPPAVSVRCVARTLDLAIELSNDGWADALGVPVQLQLPGGVREVPGSLRLDDVPLRRVRGEPIVVPRVGARGRCRVSLRATVPPGTGPGSLSVLAAEHAVSAAFVPAVIRELRLRWLDGLAHATPGEPAAVVLELHNAGDVPVRADVAVGEPWTMLGHDLAPKPLAAGAHVVVRVELRLDEQVADGEEVPLTVTGTEAAGEAHACVEACVLVRDRPWLALDDLPVRDGDDAVRYTVRHVGTTPARALTIHAGDLTRPLDDLDPGERAEVVLPLEVARRGAAVHVRGRHALQLPARDGRPAARVELDAELPDAVVAGAPFALLIRCATADDVDALRLRLTGMRGVRHVAGSTVLDAVPLLDHGDRAPLAEPGLQLRGLAAGTRFVVRCLLVADAGEGERTLQLAVDVDDEPGPMLARTLTVTAYDGFATRPQGLAYHVDACSLVCAAVPAPAAPSEPAALQPEPVVAGGEQVEDYTLLHRFDDDRVALLVRALRAAAPRGLASRLLPLRALFPDAEGGGDADAQRALACAGEALGDVFDRLSVKLCIPGFAADGDDLEDGVLRVALDALCAQLLATPTTSAAGDAACVQLSASRVREARATLAVAPYGAPEVVQLLLDLVPNRCEDPLLGAALTRWAQAARAAVDAAAAGGRLAFDDALARGPIADALDDAGASVLAALRARGAVSGGVA